MCTSQSCVLSNAISNASGISWFSQKLKEGGLISSQVRNAVDATTSFSSTEKCSLLLSAVDFSNPKAFHILLEILRANPALYPSADMLELSHGKSILHSPDFNMIYTYKTVYVVYGLDSELNDFHSSFSVVTHLYFRKL